MGGEGEGDSAAFALTSNIKKRTVCIRVMLDCDCN